MANRTWSQWLQDQEKSLENSQIGKLLIAHQNALSNTVKNAESRIPHVPLPTPQGAITSFAHTAGGLIDAAIHPYSTATQMAENAVAVPTGLVAQGLGRAGINTRGINPQAHDKGLAAARAAEQSISDLSPTSPTWKTDPFGNALTAGTLLEGGEGLLGKLGAPAKYTAPIGRAGRVLQAPATMPIRLAASAVRKAMPGNHGISPGVSDGKLTKEGQAAVDAAGIHPDVASHPKFINSFDAISQKKGAHPASAKEAVLHAAGVNPENIKSSIVEGSTPPDNVRSDVMDSIDKAKDTVKSNLGSDFGQEYANRVRERKGLYDTAFAHPGTISAEAVENLPSYISDELASGNHASITKMNSLPRSYPQTRAALLGDLGGGEGSGILRNSADWAREGEGLTLSDAQLLRNELQQGSRAAALPDTFGNINGTDLNASGALVRGYDKWFHDVTQDPNLFSSPNADLVPGDFQAAREAHGKIRDTFFSDNGASGDAHPNVVSARKVMDRSGYGKFDDDYSVSDEHASRMGDALTQGSGSDSENLSGVLNSSFGQSLAPENASNFRLHNQALGILDDAENAASSTNKSKSGKLLRTGSRGAGAAMGAFGGHELANLVAPLLGPLGVAAHYTLPEAGALAGAKSGDLLSSMVQGNTPRKQAAGAPVVRNPIDIKSITAPLAVNQELQNGSERKPNTQQQPPENGEIKMGKAVSADDFNNMPPPQEEGQPEAGQSERAKEEPSQSQSLQLGKPIKAEEFAAGGRTAFASGGRAHVNPHTVDRLANKWMKRIKQAQKESNKSTETLLNQHDSVIAHALHVAQKGV